MIKLGPGQIETLAMSGTVQNVFGASDTGSPQQRNVIVTVIGTGNVYLKVIMSTTSLTGAVSSTDYEAALTSVDGAVPFLLPSGTILVAVSDATPNLNSREIVHLGG